MTTYLVLLRGEDRMEFSVEIEASDHSTAMSRAGDMYPESSPLEVYSPADLRAREQRLYEQAQRAYDDPHYDNYDY